MAKESTNLNILDSLYNKQTEFFLARHGLSQGLHILDIGCGSGVMTSYLANTVGSSGSVTAIDKHLYQLQYAQKHTPNTTGNITWYKADLFDFAKFNRSFDLIYCRFVLHYLDEPYQALKKIYSLLQPNGIYIGIEGIVNYAYSYPKHTGWQSPNIPENVAFDCGINPNIGKQLPHLVEKLGFNCIAAEIFQPLLIGKDHKELFLQSEALAKEHSMRAKGLTEVEWQQYYDNLNDCIQNPSVTMAFYASSFVAAKKVLY